jgi:hypothetical protein
LWNDTAPLSHVVCHDRNSREQTHKVSQRPVTLFYRMQFMHTQVSYLVNGHYCKSCYPFLLPPLSIRRLALPVSGRTQQPRMAHKQPSIPSRLRDCIVPLTAVLHCTICSAYLLPHHDREKKHAEKLKFSCTAMHYDGVHVFFGLNHTCVMARSPFNSGSCDPPILTCLCGPTSTLIDWANDTVILWNASRRCLDSSAV